MAEMTLEDKIAIEAMKEIVRGHYSKGWGDASLLAADVAELSYAIARAMCKERSK